MITVHGELQQGGLAARIEVGDVDALALGVAAPHPGAGELEQEVLAELVVQPEGGAARQLRQSIRT